ncbi:5'-deoxyadenosine deaminase [Syntrophomonas palmitatica]|uniref:5'-deoxyadenosine deaminase n=1 Tax=Syntrophomonas palmitatica TaxID=402877 RepID=UPI0006D0C407|nr:5'-deoxyadenosine deaminase [Syntrophomonas palmitatica]
MLVIKNGTLVTMNPERQILQADLLIEDNCITGIGEFAAGAGDTAINAQGKLVIPGLIQTHVHLCQTLFRGMADNLELLDWLRKRIWPLEGSHDEESIYYSSLSGCAELLRGGTTAIIDMASVHHTESVFQAVELAGIRYLGGKCLMNKGEAVPASLMDTTENAVQESLDLWQRWDGQANGRIHYAFCPRFAVSCSDELLRSLAALSRQHNIPVHTHASENRSETALIEKEHGLSNINYLESLGLCNDRLILAHCIYLNNEEMKILAESKTNIVHCPGSNLKLGSGIARIPELQAMGANISLGADGAPCNNNLSMFMEMRLASLIQKPLHGPRSMPAPLVFAMATLGGAKALGLEKEVGSLEIGKKADIAVVSLDGWHHQPVQAADVYSHLVYQAQASDVYATIVDGRLLMLNGQLLCLDENDVRTRAGESVSRIIQYAGLI